MSAKKWTIKLKKRRVLRFPTLYPISVILQLGLFGAIVSGYFFVKLANDILPGFCCGTGEPKDYFSTLPNLIWISSVFVATICLQVAFLLYRYEPEIDFPRYKAFAWILIHTCLQSIPFFLMAISQEALPTYTGTYLYSGLAGVVLWLSVGKYLSKYRFDFEEFDADKRTKILRRLSITLSGLLSFILLALFLPACACQDRSKRSSTVYHMHELQTMLETYAVNWGGLYPPNIKALEQEATLPEKAYWKKFSNPCTGSDKLSENVISPEDVDLIRSVDIWGFRFDIRRGDSRCMVIYENPSALSYKITGTDHNGRMLLSFGQVLTFANTNSY